MTVQPELAGHVRPTIHTVARTIQATIDDQWQAVLAENEEQLRALYEHAGEPAYGRYAQQLVRPVQAELAQAGLHSAPPFPGTLAQSREWGPPEERARWMWSTLSDATGRSLGTLALCLYHDHTRFRVPRAPQVVGLEFTDADAIAQAVALAAGQLVNDGDTTDA